MLETRPYIMEDQIFGFVNMDMNIDSQDWGVVEHWLSKIACFGGDRNI